MANSGGGKSKGGRSTPPMYNSQGSSNSGGVFSYPFGTEAGPPKSNSGRGSNSSR